MDCLKIIKHSAALIFLVLASVAHSFATADTRKGSASPAEIALLPEPARSAPLIHKVAVIGKDARVRARRTAQTDAIGKITCHASLAAKQAGEKLIGVGTATLVVPDRQNHDRTFETVVTAAHLLFGLQGDAPRYCTFKPFGGRVGNAFEIIPMTPSAKVDLSLSKNRMQDYAIGIIQQRITRCQADACAGRSPDASAKNRAQPLLASLLSQEDYNRLRQPDAAPRLSSIGVIGYSPKQGVLLETSSAPIKRQFFGQSKADQSCQIYDYTSASVVRHGCDIDVGSSGGPFLGRMAQTVDGTQRTSFWHFGIQSSEKLDGSSNVARLHTQNDLQFIQHLHDTYLDAAQRATE